MNRSDLVTLYDQLRLVVLPPGSEPDARAAARALNRWLKGVRSKLLHAVGLMARSEPVPPELARELLRAGASAGAQREALRQKFGIEF